MSLLALPLGYLLGALPFSAWIARLHGVNLREQGSGNLGATNVYRVIGWKQGVLALILDTAKGTAAVFLARRMGEADAALLPALVGLAAVVGHMITPFAGFKGGKGVATGLGVFLGLAPIPAVLAMLVWIAVLAFCGWVSLASVVAAVLLPVFIGAFRGDLGAGAPWVLVLSMCTAVLVVMRHRSNWERIVSGREQAIWEKRRETPGYGAHPMEDSQR